MELRVWRGEQASQCVYKVLLLLTFCRQIFGGSRFPVSLSAASASERWKESDWVSLESKIHTGELPRLTLELKFPTGAKHVVNITQYQHLLPARYQLFVQTHGSDKLSAVSSRSNAPKPECFYHHSISDSPSFVTAAVNLCGGGVSGVVHISPSEAYTIEPTLTGGVIMHHASKHGRMDDDEQISTGTFDRETYKLPPLPGHEERRRKRAAVRFGPPGRPLIVEMHIVVDTHYVRKYGPSLAEVEKRVVNTINYVSVLYRSLGISIALVGLEIWSVQNKINIPSENVDSHTLWQSFLQYRAASINPMLPNDNAQLISGAPFTGTNLGKATVNGMCDYRHSGGVNTDKYKDFTHVAVTVAHEMGHNLGFDHDKSECVCADPTCIMTAVLNSNVLATKWSTCSKQSLREAIDTNKVDICLHNLPDTVVGLPAVCGNHYTEQGEECDCGPAEFCTNPCCDPTTCRLRAAAVCGSGECCDLATCNYKPRSTLCRETSDGGTCDLPEFCSGRSSSCPSDAHKRDGTPCPSHGDYCHSGECRSHNAQCRLLYGSNSYSAPNVCYSANIEGKFYGHCGAQWKSKTETEFVGCTRMSDTLCGQLQCVTSTEYGQFASLQPYVVSYGKITRTLDFRSRTSVECRSAILGLYYRPFHDYGSVPDGASCGSGHYCVNRRCTSVPVSRPVPTLPVAPTVFSPTATSVSGGSAMPTVPVSACDPSVTCHSRGVCDSVGHCYCDLGFAAPFCNVPGGGGSSHSNPASVAVDASLPLALIISFSAALPMLIILLGVLYWKRRTLLQGTCCAREVKSFTMVPKAIPQRDGSGGSSNVSTVSSHFNNTAYEGERYKPGLSNDLPRPSLPYKATHQNGSGGNGALSPWNTANSLSPAATAPEFESTDPHSTYNPTRQAPPPPRPSLISSAKPPTPLVPSNKTPKLPRLPSKGSFPRSDMHKPVVRFESASDKEIGNPAQANGTTRPSPGNGFSKPRPPGVHVGTTKPSPADGSTFSPPTLPSKLKKVAREWPPKGQP